MHAFMEMMVIWNTRLGLKGCSFQTWMYEASSPTENDKWKARVRLYRPRKTVLQVSLSKNQKSQFSWKIFPLKTINHIFFILLVLNHVTRGVYKTVKDKIFFNVSLTMWSLVPNGLASKNKSLRYIQLAFAGQS